MKKAFLCILIMISFWSHNASSDPLSESLVYHAYFGTAQDVKRLLNKGADANALDEHQWPVLSIAADRSDKEAFPIADALLKAGADPNRGTPESYPLIRAIHNNNAALVASLMMHGVNLAVSDEKGRTATQLAAEAKDQEINYYISKRSHEEEQLRIYLHSDVHLRQILDRYVFNSCAFQYWGYYLKSKQDKDMQVEQLQSVIEEHSRVAAESGARAARYFPEIYAMHFDRITTMIRDTINQQLNSMISNRNRRIQGIGKYADMKKRCDAILTKIKGDQKGPVKT